MSILADDDPARQEFISKAYELLGIFFCHMNIRIIIPWQETCVTYCSDHTAARKIKIYIMAGADIIDLFEQCKKSPLYIRYHCRPPSDNAYESGHRDDQVITVPS